MRMLLESYPQFRVVGNTGNIDEALKLVAHQQPDIILLELNLNQFNNLELIPRLLDAAKNARVILVTSETDNDIHCQAAQLGAMGIVLKDQSPDVLVKAIDKVSAGEAWLDRTTVATVLTKMSRTQPENADPDAEKLASLTSREREIITLVGQGLKNQQIAERVGLSEITVRHYLTSIFSKLEVSDRLELIIYAYQHNLAQLPS
jgi:DNA-binding NarL/FixJ family response regulator